MTVLQILTIIYNSLDDDQKEAFLKKILKQTDTATVFEVLAEKHVSISLKSQLSSDSEFLKFF